MARYRGNDFSDHKRLQETRKELMDSQRNLAKWINIAKMLTHLDICQEDKDCTVCREARRAYCEALDALPVRIYL